MSRDPRVDAYIAKSAHFARPILEHIRAVVHDACPEVEETIKWGMPFFMHEGILCHMAAFKQHCALGFRGADRVQGEQGVTEGAMGSFGRLTSVRDLPSKKVLAGYVKKAAALNASGTRGRPRATTKRAALAVPPDLAAALRKNRRAAANFDAFSPSARREYIEWITEAKQPATRERRLATTIEWVADGKQRNWKYMAK